MKIDFITSFQSKWTSVYIDDVIVYIDDVMMFALALINDSVKINI